MWQLDNYEKLNILDGWSWFCEYHDSYGLGDDEDEVLFMAGAHMHYHSPFGDDCIIDLKSHNKRGPKNGLHVIK